MLEFHNVSFDYGPKKVLDNLSFTVSRGEIVAIMGGSGIGKSTILNLCAGLRKPKSGTIICNASKISYAFQEPRLVPWLSVLQNVKAVLPADEAALPHALEALELVKLSESTGLYPNELSGGMKSRASLARAIAHGGDLYLLDEPFSALDEHLRQELCIALREHIKKTNATALLVTHQPSDAALLADRTITLS